VYQVVLSVTALCCAPLCAQSRTNEVKREVKHDVSPALRTLKPQRPTRMAVSTEGEEAENRVVKPRRVPATSSVRDLAVQRMAATPLTPTAGLNFDGVSAIGGRAVPDTNGAVGATQYFQWVNVDFEIFDKKTGASIYGPADASTIWTGFAPCNTTDDSDVVVEYDKMARVWVLEQHVVGGPANNYQCIAVSTTSDATATYNRYVFSLPNHFPDYPKISVWPDAYYLTMNEQDPTTFAALGAYVCALDRTNMLLGNPATSQCFQLSSTYNSLLPADLDGSILPPAGSPNYLLNLGTNAVNLWRFHVDWATPANTTLTGPTTIPVTTFQFGCHVSATCAPQLGTTQLVDGLGDRLMFRLPYRHFADGHESLVATHSVNTPTAVRWYEIQNPGGTPYVFQQGTYAPDSNYRWMGSIAMDQVGNVAVGYNVSSASMFPAIRYTGRLQSDPLNTMETETSIIEGTGSEVGSNRWGDYSDMTIDPSDDCTFWYTGEYFAVNGDLNWHSRIASFSFPSCTSTPAVTLAPNGLNFAGQAVGTTSASQTVTLTNKQSVALNISGVAVTGDYLESDNCASSSPIAPSGTCTIQVSFKPTTTGTRTGQVTVSDDAPGGSQVVNMSGTGGAPTLGLSMSNLRFSALVGSTSSAQTVTVKNIGAGLLIIGSIVASGDYAETDTCVSKQLSAGASCTITVAFSPAVTGPISGVITINDNGTNGAPHRISLSGTGLVTIGVSPSTLTFPLTNVGSTSAAQIVTVTNNAATAQNISWATSGNFSAVAGGVTPCGSTLNAASACTLSVTFSPTTNGTAGIIKGNVAVSDTASGVAYNPQSVSLTGSATGGASSNPLAFSPPTAALGPTVVGTTKSISITMQNVSGSSLTLSSLSTDGEFTVTPSGTKPCTNGVVLAASAKCTFTVSATPTNNGALLGGVTAVDNATTGPTKQVYNVSATGYWPITLSPSHLTFPATTVGTTSAPLTVTAKNNSASAVTLNNLFASGDYAVVSQGTTPCSPTMTLNPGVTCTFGVTFSPTVKATISGAVTVSHTAPNGPQVVGTTGSGN
jgi:hypothetical protein